MAEIELMGDIPVLVETVKVDKLFCELCGDFGEFDIVKCRGKISPKILARAVCKNCQKGL